MTEITEMTTRFGQPFRPPPAPRVKKSMFLFSNLKPGETVSFCHDGESQAKYGKVVRTFWDETRKKITHEISMHKCGKLIYWNDLEPRSRDDRFIEIETCRPLYDPNDDEALSRILLEEDLFIAPLRFREGDRVVVCFKEGKYLARVLMTWFEESDGVHWPYQVQLENGEKIRGTAFCCVTEDHPSFITSFEEWSSQSEEMQRNLLDEIDNEERADSKRTSKRSEKKRRKKNKKAAKKGEAAVISEMQSLEIGEDDKDEEEEKEEPTPPPPTPPVEDKAAGDDTCIICLENIKTHASIPCGHFLLCGNCVSKQILTSTRCPYCFEENVTWVHIRF